MSYKPQIYVDFDGTISRDDTTDAILERFAAPAWHDVEAAWMRGEIGSRECMVQQVDLLRATPDALRSFVSTIEIDPGFADFMTLCRRHALPVAVLSDGMDLVANMALRRLGIAVPVISNHLTWLGGDRWCLSFPNARTDCRAAAGNCKCQRLATGTAFGIGETVLIGDGRSDFCGAGTADVVFAKGKLVGHCRERGIAHTAFADFTELNPLFARWAERRLPLPAEVALHPLDAGA